MRNFTRKQKKMLRSMIVGVASCVMLALALTVVTVANTRSAVPVRFSDIQEGASVTAPPQDISLPEQTTDLEYSAYLYETMYPTELLTDTQTSRVSTTVSEDEQVGAGGTLLLKTTETTTLPETEPETVPTTTAPETTTAPRTFASETPPATTAPAPQTTSAPSQTTKHTSKTPFTNIGGGVISNDDTVYVTLLNLVNEARAENGLNKLWYSARVHEVSTLRAYELSSYYSHTRPDGTGFHTAFSDVGVSYKCAGENIAYGRNMFKTPGEVFEAWMNSESHRENILNPDYECVAFGLAVLRVGKDTYYYWSQEFAKF